MVWHCIGKLILALHVPLRYNESFVFQGDAFRRTNECRDVMASGETLLNNLHPRSTSGSNDK